jgi:hypothetical protein
MRRVPWLPATALWFALLAAAQVVARAHADELPTHTLPPVTVYGTPEGEEQIGPYGQPRWSARGRFSSNTEVYVLPPFTFYVDLDYEGSFAKEGGIGHRFKQEFELGLPYRFQIAYENNVEVQDNRAQVTAQTIEARYALADWGKIPLNPTIFAEYNFGIGDEEAEDGGEGEGDQEVGSGSELPDSFEVRLLLAEQFLRKFQWALNVFYEQETGGEEEQELGFSQAVSYAVQGEVLKAGIEMQFLRRTEEDPGGDAEYEFDLGPGFTAKPSRRTRLDLAMLFGTTPDSPAVKVFAIFSFGLSGQEEDEVPGPASTQYR